MWPLKLLVPLLLGIHPIIDVNNRSLHPFFSFLAVLIDETDHDKGDLEGQGKNQLLTAQEEKALATWISTSMAASNMILHDLSFNWRNGRETQSSNALQTIKSFWRLIPFRLLHSFVIIIAFKRKRLMR
jgi:hypothetical protein